MGTHNYSTESYNDNIQILKNSISRINQTILPSDPSSQFSFAYSMEVTSFNRILSDLQEICAKTVSAYEKAKGEVCVADADSAAKMADPISDLATLTNTLNNITSVMSGANTGGQVLDFTQCIITVNQLTYEGIVGIDEPDFENMSDEDVKYYYDYYMNIPEDQLTDENRRQIERYLESLKSKSNYANEFVKLYEKMYGEIKINDIDKTSWDNHSPERYEYVKYLVCLGWSKILISKYFSTQAKCYTTSEAEKTFPQFQENDCIRQGQFEFCDLNLEINENGEAIFSTVARQKSPGCNGAVIVYYKNGNVIEYVKLNRYNNPTDFMSFIDWQINVIKGKDYSETEVNVTIPLGGFVEITDDPEIIESIPFIIQSHQSTKEMIDDSVNIAENLSGTKPNVSDPSDVSQLAADIVTFASETVNDAEAKFWSEQQRNSGSLVFYNY